MYAEEILFSQSRYDEDRVMLTSLVRNEPIA